MRKFNIASVVTCAAVVLVAFSAMSCRSFDRDRDAFEPQMQFAITPSRNEIVEGEVVTLTSRSANVVGTNHQVEWSSSGGNLQTERNGRIARVQFDRPGTYVVTAVLRGDDFTLTDTSTITVRPLRPSAPTR